jgi:glycosyltransferase involved in cell wall biosynthesis
VLKLLFISAHLPSPHAREAGQKTAFRNLKYLAEKYDVHLVAFRNEPEKAYDLSDLKFYCSSVKIFDINNSSRIFQALLNPSLPILVAARFIKGVEEYLTCLVNKQIFDRVHCEYGQMAVYSKAFSKIPIRSIYLHDVMVQWALRRLIYYSNPVFKIFYLTDYLKVKNWERNFYSGFQKVYVPSGKDASFLQSVNSTLDSRIKVLPLDFQLNEIIQTPEAYNCNCEKDSMLFWGAMNRKENETGILWFIKNIFVRIRTYKPQAKLYIVGNAPSKRLLSMAGDDIIVTGYVENPEAYFQKAQIAIVPLLFGAGLKIKTMESLAAGLPVVSTDVGSEGIDATEEEGLFTVPGNKPAQFLDAVLKLLNDPELCAVLGKKGAAWVRSYYRFEPEALLEVEHNSL